MLVLNNKAGKIITVGVLWGFLNFLYCEIVAHEETAKHTHSVENEAFPRGNEDRILNVSGTTGNTLTFNSGSWGRPI